MQYQNSPSCEIGGEGVTVSLGKRVVDKFMTSQESSWYAGHDASDRQGKKFQTCYPAW